ncbi:hypothetical protein [Sphingomonas hylomeconis]|uniref:Transposase n=1 Tax=Sphingomonas hylomeconis TaxID=1395958 RepID=A0ABV7SYE7_9SPHN|nr:hypothetical protein [Sphingomonas hylomeconis]
MIGGELTVAKPRKSKREKVDRHPWDWYVEQAWAPPRDTAPVPLRFELAA